MGKSSIVMKVEPGAILREFSPVQTRELCQAWIESFGRNGGVNTKAYLWHVFSYGTNACLSLRAASDEYEKQVAPSFIVMANDRRQANVRPVRSSVLDWFVFPPNFAWTMAFTHEDGWLGPYFAWHVDYERLNKENMIRKNQRIEAARKKGWL